METGTWQDMTVLHYLGQALADRKQLRISENNRLDRGGVALDPILTAQIKAEADSSEEAYNRMLMAEYERCVPEGVRKWAAAIPGLATGELFPRIIASIGHPRIATPRHPDPDDPQRRLVSDEAYIRGPHELRQYCGRGDPNRKPYKGMTQEDLFAMGKIKEVTPLLYTWSSSLVKNATPAKPGSKHPGEPKSAYAASSKWWAMFTDARLKYAGHEGKCEGTDWPAKCAGSHRRHSWLVSTAGNRRPLSVTAFSPHGIHGAADYLDFPVVVSPVRAPDMDVYTRANSHAELDAIIPAMPVLLCQNKKVPPAKPNGCGITVHREWGELGSPWRPGHIEMAAHRKVQQKFLDELWEIAGLDGETPYEFRWLRDYSAGEN